MKLTSNSENSKFGIRPCKKEDISLVMDINETTLPENYPLFFYEQILERYPEAFTLAYLKDHPKTIVGYIMWRVERGPSSFTLDYVKKGHLVSLAVLPQFRRQGVANLILNASMDVVAEYEVSEYVLEVRVSNTGAINLYQNLHQYEKIKIITQYYRDGEDAFYMCKFHDPSKKYVAGTTGMSDEEIVSFYERQKKDYLCYHCPNCGTLLIKGLYYSLPGSINPNDSTTISCANCGFKLKYYDISQGNYDISAQE